jgi:hypothetical protein
MIFSDLSEGHEYIMRSLEMMSEFMETEDSTYKDEDEEMNNRAVDVVGDYVSWDSSGGTARGRIVRVVREGTLQVPETDFTINAEDDDPAVLIRLYRELRDGYVATDTLVGHKASTLTSIGTLPEPSAEAARKISLRLAQAIINNTK